MGADKRRLIRVSATVTATVNQIFAWVANVSMVETTIDVIPTTIVNLDIARMTMTVWKVLHAFGVRLVLRVRKITAALGGIGMSAQKNALGSKKSRLRATNCSKQFVNKKPSRSERK